MEPVEEKEPTADELLAQLLAQALARLFLQQPQEHDAAKQERHAEEAL